MTFQSLVWGPEAAAGPSDVPRLQVPITA